MTVLNLLLITVLIIWVNFSCDNKVEQSEFSTAIGNLGQH